VTICHLSKAFAEKSPVVVNVLKRMELEEKVATLIWCNSIFAVTQMFWKEVEEICVSSFATGL